MEIESSSPIGGEAIMDATSRSTKYFRALFLEGEMSRLIREKDWSRTPFGPIENWPTCLKVALDIALPSQFPIVIFWGPEYRMLYNDAYRPVFGRDKHPGFIGESYGDCWPTVWDTEKRKMDDVRLSAKANWYTDSYTPVVRSGYLEETYFTYSYSPLFLEDGSVGGIYATVSETTSRVIGERQLRVLRELSAHVVDATGPKEALQKAAHVASTSGKWDVPFVNLYLLDPECKHAILSTATGLDKRGGFLCPEVVTLNGAQERTRTSDQEDGGSSCSCSEEEAETEIEQGGFFCELFREVVRTKSSREYDLTSFGDDVPICAAWETRPRMCMVMPMMSQTAEKVVGILVAGVNPCHDLDENYRIFLNLFCNQVSAALASSIAREEERKRAEALEELDKAKTAFFSNISHEFRTPLTLMLGPIEDLLGHAELQIEREQLTLIHRNALRLYKLVNSLLDFSRIEAGRARAQFEAVDLASLTADLTSIFRSATERSGLELRTNIQTLEQQVLVDKEMWEKIVLNLISNALKFTMHGHIAVTLSTPASNPNCAELTVSDTGIGIPEEEMVHLGRRFHRVQTPGGRSYEGTGIGLALVYELVRLHGGQVEASSQLGKGTSFRVSIPFGVSHLPSDQIKHIARFAPVTHSSSSSTPRGITNPSAFSSSSSSSSSTSSSSPSSPRSQPASSSPSTSTASSSTSSSTANSPESEHQHHPATGAKEYAKMASWWLPSIAAVSSPTSVNLSTSSSPSSSSSSSPTTLFSSSPTSSSSPETPSSPRSRTAASSFCVLVDERPKKKTPKRLPKPKVLLADDNFDMREYVARLLAPKYEVISVSNGLEALSVLRAHSQAVDLVLTDVMMPFLDGFGLLKEIRAKDQTRTLPVIMLSARAGEEASVEGLDEGADDYLTKPFTARELLSRVASHLKMSRLRLEAAKIEQELRMQVNEGKERLERILASIQDAFISLDSRLRYTFVNNNAAVLLGAKKEAMIGQSVWRFMVDNEEGVVRRNLERAVTHRVDVDFEYYYPALDRWFENRIYPGADGGVTIYSVDITARKKSEERLSLLAKVGETLSASIDSRLLSVLTATVQHIGESVVADWCILDVVDENGALQRIASSRASPHLWELHKLQPNGKTTKKCYLEMELCNGEQVGLASGLRADLDFHEDKAVCAELARRAAMAIDNMFLYREAEKANQAKDHFLAALSHELRTPLTPALLLSESLLGEQLPPNVEESVRMIHESVELEVQLIDDLLDLTKIARNKLKLAFSEVSVHALLTRTLQIVAHDAAVKSIAVTLDTSAINDRVEGDPARLQQVFWNIIKNAIKFTPAGGSICIRSSNYVQPNDEHGPEQNNSEPSSPHHEEEDHEQLRQHYRHHGGGGGVPSDSPDPQQQPKVLAAEKRARVMLRVDIIDTGIGIESHFLPHLFGAFEQGDASITLRFGGLGLGLAISRSLVEMHHGLLGARSEGLSHGSTFSVCLPTLEHKAPAAELPARLPETSDTASATPKGPTASAPLPSSPATRFPGVVSALAKPLKVLLVEDNKSTLMIMSRLLRQKLGFDVLVAVSVADALQVAEKEKGAFDLVISDIGLPDGTGTQLMHTLRDRYNLRGIALSGYGMEEDVRRSKEAGFQLHLTKPVHFSSLTEAIQTLLAPSTPTPTPASASATSSASSTSDYSSCSSSSSSSSSSSTTATTAGPEPTSSCSSSSSSLSFSRDVTPPAPSASTTFAPPHPPSLLTASLRQSATPDTTGGLTAFTSSSSSSSPSASRS